MTAFIAWFTPARRKAIYGVVAAAIAALLAFGVISPDQLDAATESVVKVVAALTALMAFLNTHPDVPPVIGDGTADGNDYEGQ